ncbi:hypothetical protein CB0940_10721 [Cercospora beticola]|uniref:Uncharacterized protein n=1 Tax=Cercospora beticola TaxID=122368 RepID=A0A2G5HVI9_CERBT|nr:hypothetical protein CB0940_10721 [Cercospora beticola]PIA96262.1 hypothetical protein CB0940_10721 [Cercospora beticola]WPB07448.1 hypothetical protein RHO25_012109 [Cercospora beticola]
MAKNQPPKKGVAYKPKKKSSEPTAAQVGPVQDTLSLPSSGLESDDDDGDDMPLTVSNASLINRKRKRTTKTAPEQLDEKPKKPRVSAEISRPRPQTLRRQAPSKAHDPENAPSKEAMCRAMRQDSKVGLREFSDAEKRDFCIVHLPAYLGTATMTTSPFQIDQWIESWWNRHGKQSWAKLKKRQREFESASSGSDASTLSISDVSAYKQSGKAPRAALKSVVQPQIPFSELPKIEKKSKKRKSSAGEEEDGVLRALSTNKKARTGTSETHADLSHQMVGAAEDRTSTSRETSNANVTPIAAWKDIEKAPETAVEKADTPQARPMTGREAIALAEKQNREAREVAERKTYDEKQTDVDGEIAKRLTEPSQVPKVNVPSFGAYNVLESLGIGKK